MQDIVWHNYLKSEGKSASTVNARLACVLETSQYFYKRCLLTYSYLTGRSYESGTHELFEERADEAILQDDILRSELPRLKPDRVFGLQATENLEDLLSQPMRRPLPGAGGNTVGDVVRSSPFKPNSKPLFFPFLVLEAKSESSSNGFDAIQAQTALPIRALLRLQENLQSHVADADVDAGAKCHFDPLVWFLASRGDAWRVYGCHVRKGEQNERDRYVSADLLIFSLETKIGEAMRWRRGSRGGVLID